MALFFTFIASAGAKPPPSAVAQPGKEPAAYAIYAAKPDYPYALRARRVQGAGVFQVHIRADGTVDLFSC